MRQSEKNSSITVKTTKGIKLHTVQKLIITVNENRLVFLKIINAKIINNLFSANKPHNINIFRRPR